MTNFQVKIGARFRDSCFRRSGGKHGMRLIASETARKWLDESAQTVQRQVSAVGRENSTQAVLDIAAASKRKKSS